MTPLEKLRERVEALKIEAISADWEQFKLKFLESQSIQALQTKQDRQIQSLEKELTQLLKRIA